MLTYAANCRATVACQPHIILRCSVCCCTCQTQIILCLQTLHDMTFSDHLVHHLCRPATNYTVLPRVVLYLPTHILLCCSTSYQNTCDKPHAVCSPPAAPHTLYCAAATRVFSVIHTNSNIWEVSLKPRNVNGPLSVHHLLTGLPWWSLFLPPPFCDCE